MKHRLGAAVLLTLVAVGLQNPAARAATAPPIGTTPADVATASAAPGHPWTPGPAAYTVGSQKDVPVTMADGTIIETNVFYPVINGAAAPGPFPVLLIQTPYGKDGAGVAGGGVGEDAFLVQHGYIDVVADVRGTGDSGGEFGLFDPVQTTDGVSLVSWAAKLPHSNGKVGTYGASYLGIDQLMTAGSVGPGSPLKAIFPMVSATDLYRDTAFMGGILDSEFGAAYLGLTSGLNLANPAVTAVQDPTALAGLTPVELKHLQDIYDFDAQFIAQTVAGGASAFNDDYWKARQPSAILPNIVSNGIAAYLVGGEYDLFQRGEPHNYAALQNLWAGGPADAPMVPGQKVTGKYQLWDGPFTHLTGSAVNTDELMLRWFDTWLKGIDTGMESTPTPLHYFDLGTNTYTETATFPFTGLTPTRFYLDSTAKSGSAAVSLNDGTLSTTPPTSGSDTMIWSPTGTPCGTAVDQWATGPIETVQQEAGFAGTPCLQDDRLAEAGTSALTYTTAPLSKDTVLGGALSATIYATATTKDSEWVVEVEDVGTDGTSKPLTEGALLGSLRAVDQSKSWTAADGQPVLPFHPYTAASAQPVVPGDVTRYDVEIFPTLSTIAAGHRIRVTISSADAPHLQPSVPETANLVGGVYAVQHTKAAPSSIELPLSTVPASVKAAPAGTSSAAKAGVKKSVKAPTVTAPTRSLAATGASTWLSLAGVLMVVGGLGLRRRQRSWAR